MKSANIYTHAWSCGLVTTGMRELFLISQQAGRGLDSEMLLDVNPSRGSVVAQQLANLTSIHEDKDSLPGLTQQVKGPALP